MVEGIVYRYRTGMPWRDLPRGEFGPWKTVWKRHRRYAGDGTWDRVLAQLLAEADTAGLVDWNVSVDGTINRAHQHATNTTRPEQDTGGTVGITRIDRWTRLNPQVMLEQVLDDIRVPRPGRGRPRTPSCVYVLV